MHIHLKILLISLLLVFIGSSCARRGFDNDGMTVFRYNEASGITSLDPAHAKDQANIWACNQIFDGLVSLDTNLAPVPCIAKRWEISDDGLTYTFFLRDDVSFFAKDFFEPRRVVAEDFVFSLSRILDPTVASPGSWIFSKVAETDGKPAFEALSDTVFRIRLKEPFPPFLGILSMVYCSVVPREALEEPSVEFRRDPVGTGPFKPAIWKDGIKLVLVRNENYFQLEGSNRLPYLDAVSITFLADQQSAFLEFVKGNLDFISGLDPAYKDEILTSNGQLNPKYSDRIELIKAPYLNTEYFGFYLGENDNTSPLSKEFRRSVNFAINRDKMIRFLRNGIGTPGYYGIIPAGMPAYDDTHGGYFYDPDSARALLERSVEKDRGQLPVLRLHTTSEYLDICKYVQSQLSDIGIELEIEVHPPASLKELKARRELGFFRASWIADYPDEENYLSLFYSGNFAPGGPNYTHFTNDIFDSLYQVSQQLTEDHERKAVYRLMNEIIIEEAPIVVLYYDEVTRFVRKDVEGLGTNPMNLLDLRKTRKIR